MPDRCGRRMLAAHRPGREASVLRDCDALHSVLATVRDCLHPQHLQPFANLGFDGGFLRKLAGFESSNTPARR